MHANWMYVCFKAKVRSRNRGHVHSFKSGSMELICREKSPRWLNRFSVVLQVYCCFLIIVHWQEFQQISKETSRNVSWSTVCMPGVLLQLLCSFALQLIKSRKDLLDMVSAGLHVGAACNRKVSSPGKDYCVVFSGKALNCHSTSLHSGDSINVGNSKLFKGRCLLNTKILLWRKNRS